MNIKYIDIILICILVLIVGIYIWGEKKSKLKQKTPITIEPFAQESIIGASNSSNSKFSIFFSSCGQFAEDAAASSGDSSTGARWDKGPTYQKCAAQAWPNMPILTNASAAYVAAVRNSSGGEYTIRTGSAPAGKSSPALGIQVWTVPVSGRYNIKAAGAAGGYARPEDTVWGGSVNANGGRGAVISGDFDLVEGEKLEIIVGQKGQRTGDPGAVASNAIPAGGGGGGGSFVYSVLDNNLTKDEIAVMNSTQIITSGGGWASNGSRRIDRNLKALMVAGGGGGGNTYGPPASATTLVVCDAISAGTYEPNVRQSELGDAKANQGGGMSRGDYGWGAGGGGGWSEAGQSGYMDKDVRNQLVPAWKLTTRQSRNGAASKSIKVGRPIRNASQASTYPNGAADDDRYMKSGGSAATTKRDWHVTGGLYWEPSAGLEADSCAKGGEGGYLSTWRNRGGFGGGGGNGAHEGGGGGGWQGGSTRPSVKSSYTTSNYGPQHGAEGGKSLNMCISNTQTSANGKWDSNGYVRITFQAAVKTVRAMVEEGASQISTINTALATAKAAIEKNAAKILTNSTVGTDAAASALASKNTAVLAATAATTAKGAAALIKSQLNKLQTSMESQQAASVSQQAAYSSQQANTFSSQQAAYSSQQAALEAKTSTMTSNLTSQQAQIIGAIDDKKTLAKQALSDQQDAYSSQQANTFSSQQAAMDAAYGTNGTALAVLQTKIGNAQIAATAATTANNLLTTNLNAAYSTLSTWNTSLASANEEQTKLAGGVNITGSIANQMQTAYTNETNKLKQDFLNKQSTLSTLQGESVQKIIKAEEDAINSLEGKTSTLASNLTTQETQIINAINVQQQQTLDEIALQQLALETQQAALSTQQANTFSTQQAAISSQQAALVSQQAAYSSQQAALVGQQAALSSQQANTFSTQQAAISSQQAALVSQQAAYSSQQENTFSTQQAALTSQQAEIKKSLEEQQKEIKKSLEVAEKKATDELEKIVTGADESSKQILKDAQQLSQDTMILSNKAIDAEVKLQQKILVVAGNIVTAQAKIAEAQQNIDDTKKNLSNSTNTINESIKNFKEMEQQITYLNSLSADMTTIKADTQKLATQMVSDKAYVDNKFNKVKDFHKQIFSTKEISLGKKLKFTCTNGVWRDQNQRDFLKLQPTCKKPPSYIPSYDTPTTTFASVPTTTFASVPTTTFASVPL